MLKGKAIGNSPRPTPPYGYPRKVCQKTPQPVLHFAVDLSEMMIIIDPTDYNSLL